MFGKNLWGPFSAVSTPKFASKYSFESFWQDLQDLYLCIFWRKEPKSKMKKWKCIIQKRRNKMKENLITYFCTAQISKFQPKIINIFSRMKNESTIFPFFVCRILHSLSFIRVLSAESRREATPVAVVPRELGHRRRPGEPRRDKWATFGNMLY